MNNIKICNITMHYYPIIGGQEVYINNLNSIFQKENYETSIFQRYTELKIFNKSIIYSTLKILKFLAFFLNLFINNSEWFLFNKSIVFSKDILKKQDILLCHYPFHYPSIDWHKKVIIVSHGVLWSKPQRSLFDIYHRKISLKLKNKDVYIVANDTHFLREIGYNIEPGINLFSEVSKNVWFIPNCVDNNIFTRDEKIKKEKIILVPRNIRYDRGIHLAIEAFNIFVKDNPEYKMLIIGRGKGKYFNFCKDIISKFNLDDKIIFIGHADQDEMINYYNRSTITLIPTIEKEGTSLSALESMSCGTTTIVSSVAGLLDLPALKTDLDINIISDTLKYAVGNYIEISKNQQKSVIENFNIELWKKAWLNVINNIKNK